MEQSRKNSWKQLGWKNEREKEMEDVLFRCIHHLTNEKDMEIAMQSLLEILGDYYQADRACLFVLDEEKQEINHTFIWQHSGENSCLEGIQQQLFAWMEREDECSEKSRGLSVESMDKKLDQDSQAYQRLKADGTERFMLATLVNQGKREGVLVIDNPMQEKENLALLRIVGEFVRGELERRHLLRELAYMSYTDLLTGLKNRNRYNKALKEYDHRTLDSLGVVIVDINGMRRINEIHGDSYGDSIIKRTAQLINDALSGEIFRIGGDEFIALMENISQEEFQEQVVALEEIFKQEKECVVSMGCIWNDQEENTKIILQQAAERLAAGKQSYYHRILKEGRADSYGGIFAEVMREVEEGKFVVYYQPQVDIQTGKVVGAEALVRKLDEEGNLIPPSKFIPFYEVEGVVSHVDLFVLKSACEAMKKWMEEGYEIHLSINFSRVTLLKPGIVDTIKHICEEQGVPTSMITVEVTESISKMGDDQLRELIQGINRAGFTISLDDFGSQYSNLSILSDMEFDEIKLDRSLVQDLESNPKSRIVMENTVNMCRDLKGTSLAEGIETKGQLELLMNYNCNYGQGYYFSKPIPEMEFRNLLQQILV